MLRTRNPKAAMPRFSRITFFPSATEEARAAARRLAHRYGNTPPDQADVVVALGGDGQMLQTLHRFMDRGVPIYGMHRGTVGFLMNDFSEDDLVERLEAAVTTVVHPLKMTARDTRGETNHTWAINEVSLFRQSHQACKLAISVDGVLRMAELIGDGALVATPAGSTAYNLSAYGPIIPLGSALLALTPLNPFRPKRWRGALLPDRSEVVFEVLEHDKRPVAAVADHTEFRDVLEVRVALDRERSITMLHDPHHGMEDRFVAEQFGSATGS